MSYFQFLVRTPFFWIALAGFWTGASISRITRSAGRIVGSRAASVAEVERVRSRGWTLFYLGMSAAMVSAIAGIFVPGSSHILDLRLVWDFLASAGFFFAVTRFKRSVGFPVLLIASLAAIVAAAALSPFHLVRETENALAFRPLSVQPDTVEIEIIHPANLPKDVAFFTLDAPGVAPVVRTLHISDYLFFLGASAAYRIDGIARAFPGAPSGSDPAAGAAEQPSRDNTVHRLAPPRDGLAGRIADYFDAHADSFPGIVARTFRPAVLTPILLQPYVLLVGPAGNVEMVPGNSGSGN